VVVVREGGEYLQRRERRLWRHFIADAVAAVGLSTALMSLAPYAVVAIPAAVAVTMLAARRLDSIRKGRRGERDVTNLLKRLPDDYYLVNDVMLGGAGGNIDHVVLGPCGVVAIETKRLAGNIRCYGDEWSVNGWRRRSISRQVNLGAVALRKFFERRHPDVRAGFIETVTVFTHPLCRLKVNRPRATVVRYSELMTVMIELGRRRRMAPAIAAQLARSLADVHAGAVPTGSQSGSTAPAR
jgi:Nuclease-related domain